MAKLFDIVYKLLWGIANLTGFTYREINIIVYFFIIPLLYFNLVDKIVGKHYFKIGFIITSAIIVVLVPDFTLFSSKLFDYSVIFLNWFNVFGWNYIVASVIICVFVPVLIYMILLYFLRKKQARNFLWFKFKTE